MNRQTISSDEDSDQGLLNEGHIFPHLSQGLPPLTHLVLLEHSGGTNSNPGNILFCRLATYNKSAYESGSKKEKNLIAKSIVLAFYDQHCWFVSKDKMSKLWKEVKMEEAIKKTKQTIRDAPGDETGPGDKDARNESNNSHKLEDEEDEMENESSHHGQSNTSLPHSVSFDDELNIREEVEGEDRKDNDDDKFKKDVLGPSIN